MSGTSLAGRARAVLGWTALGAALLAALPQGATVPVAWLALALVAFALLALLAALDLAGGGGGKAPGLPLAAGALALAALAFGLAQCLPGPSGLLAAAAEALGVSSGPLHPAWASVDVPGTLSADPIAGRQSAVRIALYLALFCVAARAGGADRRRAAAMIRVVAVAIGLLAAFGIDAASRGDNLILGGAGTRLVSASFVNRNSFATVAAFGVVASLSVLLVEAAAMPAVPAGRRRGLRDAAERFVGGGWLFLLAFAVSATALVASQSRGGALAAAAGVATVVAATRGGKGRGGAGTSRPVAPTVWLVVAAAGFALAIGAGGLLARGVSLGGEARLPVYRAMAEAIAERPLVGYGLGGFQDAFRAVVPRTAAVAGEWDLAHNTYLQMAFELGLPAAAAFFLALVLVVAPVARAAFRDGGLVPVAGLGCAVAAGVHSLFDFSLQIPAIAALFSVILGLAWARSARPAAAPRPEPGTPAAVPVPPALTPPLRTQKASPPQFARRS